MKRSIAKRLFDAIQAIEAIERFTHGMSFEDYAASEMATAAVERKFEIISEALKTNMMVRASKGNTLKDADEGNVFQGTKNMPGTSCFWSRQFVSKPFQTVIEARSIHGATQFLKPQRIFVWLLAMQHP